MKLAVHQLFHHRAHQEDDQEEQVTYCQGCQVTVAGSAHGLPGQDDHADQDAAYATYTDDRLNNCLDGVVGSLRKLIKDITLF